MSNKMISLFSIGKTQQIERQIVNNFDLDIEEVKSLLDDLRNDFFDWLKMTEGNITERIAEQISRTIECKFIEIICKVNEMPSVTEDKVKQAVQQGFYMLRENSDAFLSDLQNQFDEIKDRELSFEENLTNLCNQIAWQSDEAFNNLFEMVTPLKKIKWDFSYELREGWSCLKRADFDHAKELFTKATIQKDVIAEAYFGIALADSKIQILWDYKNCHEQPLCYDYSIEFSENPNYKLALENASEAQKDEYINFKEEIEHIQKEFEYLENSRLDYDCFICVKVSAKNGENTEDSKDADHIYHLLLRKGHKPFYSDYEIRNKKGAEYEAHILYALYKSKCMLLVCRDKEYLRTPWVKNEYMRFLKMIDDGEKKRSSLVIVFYGKKIERLPGRKGSIEGIDFSLRESDFEIVDFVDRQTKPISTNHTVTKEAIAKADIRSKPRTESKPRKAEEVAKQPKTKAAVLPAEAVKFCISCGAKNPGRAKYCMECGGTTFAEKQEEARRAGAERRLIVCMQRYLNKRRAKAQDKIEYDKTQFEIEGTTLKKYLKRDFVGEIKIPRGVKSIGWGAFYACSESTSIKLPNSVTSIGGWAFSGCEKLTIYCEASSQPSGWDKNWNPDDRPVVWGYKAK